MDIQNDIRRPAWEARKFIDKLESRLNKLLDPIHLTKLSNKRFGILWSYYSTIEETANWLLSVDLADDKYIANLSYQDRIKAIKILLDQSYSFIKTFEQFRDEFIELNVANINEETLSSISLIGNKFIALRKIAIHPASIWMTKDDIDSLYDDTKRPRVFFSSVKDGRLNLFLQKKNLKKLLNGKNYIEKAYLVDNYFGIKDEKNYDEQYESDLKYKLFVPVDSHKEILFLSFNNIDLYKSFIYLIKLISKVSLSVIKGI